MADEEHFKVNLFDGRDFDNWLFRLKTVLDEKDLVKWIDEDADLAKSNTNVESAKLAIGKADKQCKSIIVRRVADSHLEYIKDKPTSFLIIESLRKTFVRASVASEIGIRKQMLMMKCSENESLQQYFLRFDKCLRELKACGGESNDRMSVVSLMITLPAKYDMVITALETMDPEQLTMELVRNRLLDAESKQKVYSNEDDIKNDESVAMYGDRKIQCYYCKQFGHRKFECPKLKLSDNNGNYQMQHKQQSKFRKSKANIAESDVLFLADSVGCALQSKINSSISWFIDSGASEHMTNDDSLFTSSKQLNNPIPIGVAKNGVSIYATKIGIICGTTNMDGYERKCQIKDVLFVKDLKCNLFSVSRLEKAGFDIMFVEGEVHIKKNEIELIVGRRSGSLYEFKINVDKKSLMASSEVENQEHNNKRWVARGAGSALAQTRGRTPLNKKKLNSINLWHKRLGHLNINDIRRLIPLVDGIGPLIDDSEKVCEPCTLGKQIRKPFFSQNGVRSSRALELIHSDVCGPITPPTWNGKRYIVTFTDDYTHFTTVYLMEKKSEVIQHFFTFSQMVSSQFEKKISRLRCDNGGEYSSNEFKQMCRDSGIQIEYTVAYSPEQNGVAERLNRTLLDKARCMIAESKMDKQFWGEAVLNATYITNRSPTRALKMNKTPAEIWFGKRPNLSNLRVFGSTAYAHVPDVLRKKLDNKSRRMTMVGYAKNGYRLWDDKESRIVVYRDVTFNEICSVNTENNVDQQVFEIEPCNGSEDQAEQSYDDGDDNRVVLPNNDDEAEIQPMKDTSGICIESNKVLSSSRPQRVRRQPIHFNDYLSGSSLDALEEEEVNKQISLFALNAMAFVDDVPLKFEDIKKREDAADWEKAVNAEMDSLNKNRTWSLVKPPIDRSIVSSKWVFSRKRDEFGRPASYKARLVARGFTQKPGLDFLETYSPVARMTTVRLLLAIVVQQDLEVHQMDVCTAFLNGDLQEEIYMKQPDGFAEGDLVCKLNKSLYGLKQSSRVWNERFHKFITSIGFKQSQYDHCLYISEKKEETVYLLLYVDDLILIGKTLKKISLIKRVISDEFEMKDFGELRQFLGITVKRDRTKGYLELNQRAYLENVLKRFNMDSCNGISTPKECNLKLLKTDNRDTTVLTRHPYRELIGCLMYAATTTRPDLCATINYFSQFQAAATDEHWNHLKRVLRYVKGSLDLKLIYGKKGNEDVLTGFADADWGSDIIDRKSISGYVFKVFGNTISWSTKKQTTVALSSTEAEYVSLSSSVCEAIWLRGLLKELNQVVNKPTIIYEDNQGCIVTATSGKESHKLKHVDIRYHFLRNVIERGDVKVVYISTNEQIADIMTKALPTVTHAVLRRKLGLV